MVDINWRAVAAGFVVTLIVGFLSGATVPETDITLPVIGWGLTGLLGGLTAGYMAGHGYGNGAINGAVATTIGAIIVLAVLALFGTLLLGAFGLGLALFGVVFLVLYAVPGAVGGALGAMLKGREPARVGRPARR
jgi:hypothetical protein